MTEYWTVNPVKDFEDSLIVRAGEWLKAGKLVAFPTESVYGLGADARNTAALKRLFLAKGRPADNPLIIHIAKFSQLDELVTGCSQTVQRLIEQFWPGPLTLVLPMKPNAVSPTAAAGLTTVAVRMPSHPVAKGVLLAAGCPIAAPSANRSGRPSPTMAKHVKDDLDGKIDAILDGGRAGVGLESTVVECTNQILRILRPGAVTAAQIKQAVAPQITVVENSSGGTMASSEAPRSPGMKYRHYAPQGLLTVVEGSSSDQVVAWMQQQINQAKARGERTGALAFAEHTSCLQADVVLSHGSMYELEAMAHNLYASLRTFDEEKVSYIVAEACQPVDLGFAVMNRLLKASGNHLVRL